MRKVKVLYLILSFIIVFAILPTNITAQDQSMYSPPIGGWLYIFNPNLNPNFYVYYTIENKNAHLGDQTLTYKFDSSIPNDAGNQDGWRVTVHMGMAIWTSSTFLKVHYLFHIH